jgi:serine/threonine-protein kinase
MLARQHGLGHHGTDFAEVVYVDVARTATATRRHGPPVSNPVATGARAKALVAAPEAEVERYELLGELATGGMATVYLGRLRRPHGFNRLVAIKCMHPQYAKDSSFASMFVDEARLTARLRHPNIVPTLDIVADGGHLLIVMEYVEGESLAELLRLVRDSGDRIPVAIACAITHDLLLGLHEAHEARDDDGSHLAIIHRDVSPQNVVVGLDGLARVLDFGVAKARSRVHHSNDGEIKGKIPYMPPEQLYGEGIDRRVDVYAAGVLLWESLVGARLFEGASDEALVRRIDAGEVARPSTRVSGISPELDALVMRALSKDANDRFPTALAMAEALSSIAMLPPRTEISAWMKRHARHRAIPSTPIGNSRDLTVSSEGVSADAIVAVLEHRATISRTSFAPVTAASGAMAAPMRTAPPAASRLAMVLGIAGFALAGVLVGRTMRAETAHAAPAHHSATAAVAPLAANDAALAVAVAPLPAAPVAAPEAAALPAQPTKVTARGSRVTTTKATSPNAPSAATAAAPAAAAAPAKAATEAPVPAAAAAGKPASCRLPYVVDAEGHRHYKVECL